MGVGRTMSVGDFKKYVAKLNKNLMGHNGAVIRGIHSGIMSAIPIVHRSVDNAMPASPNGVAGAMDTGDYKRRWQFDLTKTGGRIFNNHPAADVIERGRKAGRKPPPFAVIKAWAQRRLGLTAAQAEIAKYPLSKAIGKRGLTGRRVLTNPGTKDAITRSVLNEMKREVNEALKRWKDANK